MNNNLKVVVTGASVLVGSIALFFIGKAIVKKIQFKNDEKRKKLVNDELGLGSTSPAAQAEEEAAKNYNPKADRVALWGYIGGGNFSTYGVEVNDLIIGLTNAELKKLAVSWKKVRKKSLYKSLDEEYDQCNFYTTNCYKSAMKRLSNLGLR